MSFTQNKAKKGKKSKKRTPDLNLEDEMHRMKIGDQQYQNAQEPAKDPHNPKNYSEKLYQIK